MTPPKDTLQQQIFRALRDRIIYGAYPAGHGLSEKEICDEFNASRTPFREAVLKLQDMKLVTVIPRYGTSVSPVDIDDVRCAFELKVKLEGLACELAAERITGELLRQLKQSIDQGIRLSKRLGSGNRFRLLEIEAGFHDIIRMASGNHVLKEYLENLHLRCARLWSLNISQSIPDIEIIEQMKAIYGALEAQDPDRARRLMEGHVQYFIDKARMQLL
jgi:DNA-binding GntR family transcriptional regulator